MSRWAAPEANSTAAEGGGTPVSRWAAPEANSTAAEGGGTPGRASSGFTLIEMMVTVALVGILASVALPLTEMSMQRQKEQELRAALREIRSAIDAFKRAGDEGRIRRSATTTGYPPTIEALVEGAADLKDPAHRKIFFLRRVPRDPMNADMVLAPAATWGKRAYSSEADRPMEGDDVYDVFSLNRRTGLNGLPYAQW